MSATLPSLSSRAEKTIVLIPVLICIGLFAAIGALDGHQSTVTFRARFGALLSILGCIQLYVSVALFANRRDSHLESSQPIGLSMFALSGAIATFGAFTFALPENDVACAVRQPIIFTCISFMGSILVARAWRVDCLVSPTLSSSSPTGAQQVDRIQLARTKTMKELSKISGWTLIVSSCGRRGAAAANRIRNQATLADSMRVTVALVLPQIILQIVNLSLPARLHSVEVYDDIYACQSNYGPLFLVIGLVLAMIPFFVALLLNIMPEGMPEVLREFDQLVACGGMCVVGLIITLPTKKLVANTIPTAHTYLSAASLLSFILPMCYKVAWPRLHALKRDCAQQLELRKRARSLVSRAA